VLGERDVDLDVDGWVLRCGLCVVLGWREGVGMGCRGEEVETTGDGVGKEDIDDGNGISAGIDCK